VTRISNPKKKIPTRSLNPLIQKIQQALKDLEHVIKRRTIETYWRIGKHVSEELMDHPDRAGYGEFVLDQVSEHCPLSRSQIYRMVQLYRTYPKVATLRQLSWSHFLCLIAVRDGHLRASLQHQAEAGKWTVRQLKCALHDRQVAEALKVKNPTDSKAPRIVLTVERGILDTYPVVSLVAGEGNTRLYLDCGFKLRRPVPASLRSKVKSGDVVIVPPATQRSQQSRITDVPRDQRFTYRARLKRIVDGDTLVVLIDVGLDHRLEQRLRLRGINASELKTPEGQKVKRYLARRLKIGSPLIIRTSKVDKYDRYLADVFYGEDRYLNQELIDAGLVTVYG